MGSKSCAYYCHFQQVASIEAGNHGKGRILAVRGTELEKPQSTHSSPRGVRAQRRLPYPESWEEALLKASRC